MGDVGGCRAGGEVEGQIVVVVRRPDCGRTLVVGIGARGEELRCAAEGGEGGGAEGVECHAVDEEVEEASVAEDGG